MQNTAITCGSCGTPVTHGLSTSELRGKAAQASKDTMAVSKALATNPVGQLAVAFAELGEARALSVGLSFAVIFALCVFLGIYLALPGWLRPSDIGAIFKTCLFGLMPFISSASASALARKVFGGAGSLGGDSFIAGVALLPLGLLAVLGGLLGIGNIEVIAFLGIFALCLTILMLYAGCTRISQLSEAQATLAVPLMVLVSTWLTKVLFTAMLT